MKEDQTKTVWLCIYPGIVLPGTTTNLLATGGDSPDTTSTGTMDGLMGYFDVKVRGRPIDVLETGVL